MRPNDSESSLKENAQFKKWERISNFFHDDKYSLWGTDQITFKDVKQGYLGDCWFISAASAVSANPDRIKKIF